MVSEKGSTALTKRLRGGKSEFSPDITVRDMTLILFASSKATLCTTSSFFVEYFKVGVFMDFSH